MELASEVIQMVEVDLWTSIITIQFSKSLESGRLTHRPVLALQRDGLERAVGEGASFSSWWLQVLN